MSAGSGRSAGPHFDCAGSNCPGTAPAFVLTAAMVFSGNPCTEDLHEHLGRLCTRQGRLRVEALPDSAPMSPAATTACTAARADLSILPVSVKVRFAVPVMIKSARQAAPHPARPTGKDRSSSDRFSVARPCMVEDVGQSSSVVLMVRKASAEVGCGHSLLVQLPSVRSPKHDVRFEMEPFIIFI